MDPKPDEFSWTDEEKHSILTIARWYDRVTRQRGREPADHPMRAILRVAEEVYVSNRQADEMDKANEDAQLDEETVASLTKEPATAAELAAVCGVLASTLGSNSGIVDVDDLQHHRAVMVKNVLAQVRLRKIRPNTWAVGTCNE